ncbi:MAG: carbohydrate kinase family protein [Anaerolineales bacterium]
MTDLDLPAPRVIFAGALSREFFITVDDHPVLDIPGGNALYAAVGYLVWDQDPPPGILTKVGENYPQSWLDDFARRRVNVEGVKILPRVVDLRKFYIYTDKMTRVEDQPMSNFARIGRPLPKALLDYDPERSNMGAEKGVGARSLRKDDLPGSYQSATTAHLCPLDYHTHNLLPAVLRQMGFTTVTLDPAPDYMEPTYYGDLPGLVTGLTAFMPREEDLRRIFRGLEVDLWKMAAEIGCCGCQVVVIRRGEQGQLLYDADRGRRWEIPAYPARVHNPTGAGDAFCGGFLAGYQRTYDPLEAVLYGNVSSSLVEEGDTPFYALDALPGLPQARLEYLRGSVREV